MNFNPTLLLSMPSGGEWLWIIIGVIVLFGGKKLPELAKGLGKGIREFNDAKDGVRKEIEDGMSAKPNNATTTTQTTITKETEIR